MTAGSDINSELYDLTIPLLKIFEQVALDGNYDALDWKKLEEIVHGAMAVGCARQADVDEVSGAARSFNVKRLAEIYQCLDGKVYGPPGRIPHVIGKIKGRVI